MAILARNRRVFDERLPDGRSVDDAVRDLSRRPAPDDEPLTPDRMSGVPSSPIRTVAPAIDDPMPAERDVYAGARNPAVPQVADLPAPPPMIQRNNKGRPVAVIGGDDPITANRALIREQEGYKAPRSTKDQILSILQGGIGAGIEYATNQNTRNRWAVGEDIAREEGQIGHELALRKSQNDLLNDQSQRDYRGAEIEHLIREPERLKAAAQEQERDNLRQIYNSQPYFDPAKNPQHKQISDRAAALGLTLPTRDEKDNFSLEWRNGELKRVSRRTGDVLGLSEPFVDQSRVPVVEDGLTVTPGQALNARATRDQRQYQRDKDTQELGRKDAEREGKGEAFRQQSASARSLGDALDKQLRDPGGLYEQRAAIQTALGREGDITTPEQKVAHSTRMSQLAALNSRIAQIEQGRNSHYSQADKLRGQAAEFNPLPRSQQRSRGGKYVPPKVSADRLRELMQ